MAIDRSATLKWLSDRGYMGRRHHSCCRPVRGKARSCGPFSTLRIGRFRPSAEAAAGDYVTTPCCGGMCTHR